MQNLSLEPAVFFAALLREGTVEQTHWASVCLREWWTGDRCFDEHVLWCAEEGRIAGTVENQHVVIEPGDVVWLMPQARHLIRAEGLHRKISIRFRFAVPCGLPRLEAPFIHVPGAGHLRDRFMLLAWHHDTCQFRLRAALTLLLADLLRAAAAGSRRDGRLGPAQIERLIRYVHDHLAEGLRAEDLARRCGLSRDTFARSFRAVTGQTPRAWLIAQRIQHAMHLLAETSQNIAAIARAVGCRDHRLFSRQFRSTTGLTPAAWRQRGYLRRDS